MINIIKTTIITIIISFISGMLLDYCKNLAPRILCNIGNGIPIEMNNKKFYAYIITVSNISKKIIHELNVNIQSSQNNLESTDAKITKGLKFEYSTKDNFLDVYIPFLSKGDKFSVTVYVENKYEAHNKPVIVIRSPESFKEIDSVEKKGILSSLVNIPKNVNNAMSKKKNRTIIPNKKAMVLIISIILVIIVGGVGKAYFKGTSANTQTPSAEPASNKQSTDSTGSAGETTKSTGVKTSTDGTTKNADTKAATDGGTKNTDTKAATDGTTKNTDTKTATDGGTKNTDTKAATDGGTKSTDTNSSTGGTTKSTDVNSSTGGATKSTDTNSPTSGTTGSTGN